MAPIVLLRLFRADGDFNQATPHPATPVLRNRYGSLPTGFREDPYRPGREKTPCSYLRRLRGPRSWEVKQFTIRPGRHVHACGTPIFDCSTTAGHCAQIASVSHHSGAAWANCFLYTGLAFGEQQQRRVQSPNAGCRRTTARRRLGHRQGPRVRWWSGQSQRTGRRARRASYGTCTQAASTDARSG
jgi:hypothetical protein